MSQYFKVVNPKTGEIYPEDEFCIRFTGPIYDEENFCIYAKAQGRVLKNENFGFFTRKKKSDDPKRITEFGVLSQIVENRKYSKVYQTQMPEFSKPQYYKYWVIIERSIEYNTGAILIRETMKRISSIDDWILSLDGTKTSVYNFVNEATQKGYIGRFVTKTITCWIVNPKFIWNGNFMPNNINQLFP